MTLSAQLSEAIRGRKKYIYGKRGPEIEDGHKVFQWDAYESDLDVNLTNVSQIHSFGKKVAPQGFVVIYVQPEVYKSADIGRDLDAERDILKGAEKALGVKLSWSEQSFSKTHRNEWSRTANIRSPFRAVVWD